MKLGPILLALFVLMVSAVSAGTLTVESDATTQYFNGTAWVNSASAWVHPAYSVITIPSTWIWRTYRVTSPEAQYGSNVTFKKDFNIPVCAENIKGNLKITADNEYNISLNSVFVGENNNWLTAETYPLTNLVPGANSFTIKAKNAMLADGSLGDIDTNPAALIYKADINYTGCSSGGSGGGGSGGGDPQVPEFGTVTALIVAVMGGLFIVMRR
jgi:hypothetical protein